MKKKLILSSLCLVLLLIMMLSTTLAWFTDSKANVNTMVAGKISISQEETFVQDTVIMPNVPITKNVVVTNTGNLPCYVRTLFAFEDKTYTDKNGVQQTVLGMLTATTPSGVVIDIPTGADKVQFTVTKTVGGNQETTTYTVGYYVHPQKLPHEDEDNRDVITVLNSITLNSEADNEWQIAVGDKYELFVLSQATQVDGLSQLGADGALNTAFAPITGDWCAKWFAEVLNGTASGNEITITP